MGDLYQNAAEDLANWERVVVEDNLFPIKILKIKDNEVLVNRGSDSGIQPNTYYDVWAKGDPKAKAIDKCRMMVQAWGVVSRGAILGPHHSAQSSVKAR